MQLTRTCVFPVAGLGTRMWPLTAGVPKEMLPVYNKPLIQYAIEEALEAGIERFIFVTAGHKPAIENHIEETQILKPGQAAFVRQGAPQGLGHAIRCAQLFVPDAHFAVILPDDLILSQQPCLSQMLESYRPEHGQLIAAMPVSPEHAHLYGVFSNPIRTRATLTTNQLIEKPTQVWSEAPYAIIGRYLLDRRVFEYLHQHAHLTDALNHMMPQVATTGFLFEGSRYDCGNFEGWMAANRVQAGTS